MGDARAELLARLTARLDPAQAPAPEARPEERTAAVAIILCAGREAWPGTLGQVLLMRRREDPRDRWSGQVSLPGGHRDPEDVDLVATAVRESFEEVGVDLSSAGRLLGRLPRVQAIARGRVVPMGITPFVFELEEALEPSAGPEASEAFWFPLGRAATGELDGEHRYRRGDGVLRRMPSWRHGEHVVWGLTYRMLTSFLELSAPS